MDTLLDIGMGRVATVATFYKVSDLLGSGRFSEVYRAFDGHSETDVALKIYSGFDARAHEIAKSEESTLARLAALNSEYFPKFRRSAWHRIHNRNHPLIVMELGTYVAADGHKRVLRLDEIIPKAGPAPVSVEPDVDFWTAESILRWITHLLQAVRLLHDLGIIHRDLKPANILVKRGPGQSASVPLLLDFNSSAPSQESGSARGTPRYLPPEVISGMRNTPDIADDLWAIAAVAWEMLHGQGASPDGDGGLHKAITGSVPGAVLDALKQALAIDASLRFPNAVELLNAFEKATRTDVNLPTSDEVARARSSMERLRNQIRQTLAAPGEIIVPKEIEDAVTTAIAWLADEETQSLDLVSEFVRLGPSAIPICLQQGYRLARDKTIYNEVVGAITQLAAQDREVAERSIDKFALSSNQGVRTLCLDVCEQVEYFPEVLLDSLKGDEGLLLPGERLRIANICIRFSKRRTAVLGLEKYMCREYILNPDKFFDLREMVAKKMHLLQLRDVPTKSHGVQESPHVRGLITPLLIAQDTGNCVWRELKEFDDLPDSEGREIEKGLVELMAAAFAATGLAGLEILKAGKIARLAGPNNLPVFRRFAIKLAQANGDARTWILKQKEMFPKDRDIAAVANHINSPDPGNDEHTTADELVREYLASGDPKKLNDLRFLKTDAALRYLKTHLARSGTSSDLNLVLVLLKGYQNRLRPSVVDVLLTHWDRFSATDFDATVAVLTSYSVPERLHERAVELLNAELDGPHELAARRGLDKLLR